MTLREARAQIGALRKDNVPRSSKRSTVRQGPNSGQVRLIAPKFLKPMKKVTPTVLKRKEQCGGIQHYCGLDAEVAFTEAAYNVRFKRRAHST